MGTCDDQGCTRTNMRYESDQVSGLCNETGHHGGTLRLAPSSAQRPDVAFSSRILLVALPSRSCWTIMGLHGHTRYI